MGQEKSLPVRCNSTYQEYSSSKAPTITRRRSPSRGTATTDQILSAKSSIASTTSTIRTTRTCASTCSAASHVSSASYKSIEKQAKYLRDQLHIKTYLDIIEEDRNAKRTFQPARTGIRNYTPKILLEEHPPSSASSASSASSSSSEQELDVWV